MNLFDNGRRVEISATKPRILVVGDCHFPFVDAAKLGGTLDLAKQLKPTHVVQIGDLFDLYTFSRFARSVNFISPKDELEKGRVLAAQFWADMQKAAPKAQCFQLRGNHSHRIMKDLLARAPEFEPLLSGPINKLTEFKGVYDMKSARSELAINDILFVHGWSCRPGFHRDYFGQNVVHGHTHHGGVSYKAQRGKAIYELDCGHIADVNALPLQYGDTRTTSWVAGAGFIDEFGPRFIPL